MNENRSYWWRHAATHIWRNYYRRQAQGMNAMTPEQANCDDLCRRSLAELEPWQTDFLRVYFSSPWGQDVETLSAYADHTGILENYLWQTVHRVNRRVFEFAGLLEQN